jgi:hypothetical protein
MTWRRMERPEIYSATHRGLENSETPGTAKCLRLAVLILSILRPERKPKVIPPSGQAAAEPVR